MLQIPFSALKLHKVVEKHVNICSVLSTQLSSPVYSPDMPSRLPVQDIFAGLVTSIGTAIRYWFHYTLVAFAWLGVVPLTACKSHFLQTFGLLLFKVGVFLPVLLRWWLTHLVSHLVLIQSQCCSLKFWDYFTW